MPRFSVNKLGEYISARPARRTTIIREQKYPHNFIITRYNDARNIIVDYFLSNYDDQIITDGIEQLNQKPLENNFQQNDKDNSIEALNAILGMNKPNLANLILIRSQNNPYLQINGLDISVNPDILISGTDNRGNTLVGALKIHIIKTHPATEDTLKYISTIERKWVEINKQANHKVKNSLCFSIDVFSQNYEVAPSSHVRRFRDIDAACLEIADRWLNL